MRNALPVQEPVFRGHLHAYYTLTAAFSFYVRTMHLLLPIAYFENSRVETLVGQKYVRNDEPLTPR